MERKASSPLILDPNPKPRVNLYRLGVILNILLIFLTIVMISLGGVTRLTGSGLSMVSWDLLMGIFPPFTDAAWMAKFRHYQQFPEYQILNFKMTLEGFKTIFYFEYSHRLLGRLIGLLTFALMVVAFWRKNPTSTKIKAFLLVVVVGFQGLLGWYMVKSGLVDVPRVSHYRLLAHLLLAILFLTMLLDFLYRALQPWLAEKQETVSGYPSSLSLMLNLTLGSLLIQIIFGALLAGLDAGLVSTTYPEMFGAWIPENLMVFPGSLLNRIFDNSVWINFFHRHWGILTAVLLFISSIGIILFFVLRYSDSKYRFFMIWLGLALAGLALLQPLIGILTLVMRVPVSLGAIHQLLAVLIWAALISIKILNPITILHPTSNR